MTGAWIALAGCAPTPADFDPESVIGASCKVASDQRQTFMAKVPAFPLHLKADSTFTASERASIETAVARWNGLGVTLIGQGFFDLQFSPLAPAFYTADPRDCSDDTFGSAGTFSIVRETSAQRWEKMKFSDSIPAATLRCYSHGEVDHQVVLTYMKIIDELQLSSIVLHELGHTLGLDHSCMNSGDSLAKFRGCRDIASSHPYHQAVMFPALQSRAHTWDQPEIKDQLRENDVERTQCLYGATH